MSRQWRAQGIVTVSDHLCPQVDALEPQARVVRRHDGNPAIDPVIVVSDAGELLGWITDRHDMGGVDILCAAHEWTCRCGVTAVSPKWVDHWMAGWTPRAPERLEAHWREAHGLVDAQVGLWG